jgi:hypothetical protein
MNDVFFIIDVDGTVADSLPRVKELCASVGVDYENSNIDKIWTDETMMRFLYEENMMQDEIIPGAEQVLDLAKKCHATPIVLTGRNCYAREPTRKWLSVKLGVPDEVSLIMRPQNMKGIRTADCKEEIFKNEVLRHHPDATFIFFEDDEETIKRYSKYGLVLKAPECWKCLGY